MTDQNFYLHDDLSKQDKNAKKAPSAFIIFSQEFRVYVKQQFPTLSQDQILRVVTRRWQILSKEQRVPFEKRSVDFKNRIDNGIKDPQSVSVPSEALVITDEFLQQIGDILEETNLN